VLLGNDGGEHLLRRLAEWLAIPHRIVYADPQITDELAEFLYGCDIRCVPPAQVRGRSGAACRNEAIREMLRTGPRPAFVQYLRTESRLAESWLLEASRHLKMNPKIGLVCGQVLVTGQKTARQRLHATRLNGPSGNCCSFPGEALIRTDAFEIIAGFDERIKALEEIEFVDRLYAHGWSATRIDAPMIDLSLETIGWCEWLGHQFRMGHRESGLLACSPAPALRFRRRLRWEWCLTSILGLGSFVGLVLSDKLIAAGLLSVVLFVMAGIKMAVHPQQPPAALLRPRALSVADVSVLAISTALRVCGEFAYTFIHYRSRKNPKPLRFLGTYQPPTSKHQLPPPNRTSLTR